MDHDHYCCRGCRRRTVAWWSLLRDDLPDRELFFCGVCSDANAEALVRQGWVQVADERDTPAPVADPAPLTQ